MGVADKSNRRILRNFIQWTQIYVVSNFLKLLLTDLPWLTDWLTEKSFRHEQIDKWTPCTYFPHCWHLVNGIGKKGAGPGTKGRLRVWWESRSCGCERKLSTLRWRQCVTYTRVLWHVTQSHTSNWFLPYLSTLYNNNITMEADILSLQVVKSVANFLEDDCLKKGMK